IDESDLYLDGGNPQSLCSFFLTFHHFLFPQLPVIKSRCNKWNEQDYEEEIEKNLHVIVVDDKSAEYRANHSSYRCDAVDEPLIESLSSRRCQLIGNCRKGRPHNDFPHR